MAIILWNLFCAKHGNLFPYTVGEKHEIAMHWTETLKLYYFF